VRILEKSKLPVLGVIPYLKLETCLRKAFNWMDRNLVSKDQHH
jgi:hypothetical protein